MRDNWTKLHNIYLNINKNGKGQLKRVTKEMKRGNSEEIKM
jgi:hypothetical protein